MDCDLMAEEEKHPIVEKHEEGKKREMKFSVKLTRNDIISLVVLAIFLIIISIPTFISKTNCEVGRPEYKCATFKDVLIENCNYWGKYSCNTNADPSLPQIEWYIQNLCDLQNNYHNSGLKCSDLKIACNQITGNQTCPVGV